MFTVQHHISSFAIELWNTMLNREVFISQCFFFCWADENVKKKIPIVSVDVVCRQLPSFSCCRMMANLLTPVVGLGDFATFRAVTGFDVEEMFSHIQFPGTYQAVLSLLCSTVILGLVFVFMPCWSLFLTLKTPSVAPVLLSILVTSYGKKLGSEMAQKVLNFHFDLTGYCTCFRLN